jgi:D-alanyl-D-alanine carboxypeptidase/D-alanyl-D-alanine-endopeptidase (penicillin-binding protein 4)
MVKGRISTNHSYRISLFFVGTLFIVSSCSVSKKIAKTATGDVLQAPSLQTAHVGISIYEPATGKYWYDHQGDKYFVPASNTKIPTCYAAMKYLGDSLVGLRYTRLGGNNSKDIWIQATGDPTLLHPDYKKHPVAEFLLKDTSVNFVLANNKQWRDNALGAGWTWNDYDAAYMAERSLFPIYGNVIRFYGDQATLDIRPGGMQLAQSDTTIKALFSPTTKKYRFSRLKDQNVFTWQEASEDLRYEEIPFITSEQMTIRLLKDSLRGLKLSSAANIALKNPSTLYSQPTDSMLRPMMHRSDNFFAEQALLMVSNEKLGFMSDARIIDTLLKTDLKDLPQKPRWVDGSGLSRYNLFSPRDFIYILEKMKNEFGMDRIKDILPTGGEGTIGSYYKSETGYIYVKTGTLSGVVALSGFLDTKKGKKLIFSVLVNNHQASATDVRRAVEKFLQGIRNNY